MIHEALSYDQLRERLTPDKVGLLGCLSPRRIGVLSFVTFLEHRHYKPGTPASQELIVAILKFQGMVFALVAFPRYRFPQALWLANQLGLRVADGVPTVASATGITHFPLQLPNLFTLENVPGHFAYKNSDALLKSAFDFEDEAIERETNAGRPQAVTR